MNAQEELAFIDRLIQRFRKDGQKSSCLTEKACMATVEAKLRQIKKDIIEYEKTRSNSETGGE